MEQATSVAIFWDFENCPPPALSSGYEIVSLIRGAIEQFGRVKLFRAYTEMNEMYPKVLNLMSELQASGVSLVNCPHSGLKDVVDKMLIVDASMYAADNPNVVVVLIAGDRDYAYLISTLRLRKHDVVVVIPSSQVHTSVRAHASHVLQWELITSSEKVPDTTGSSTAPQIESNIFLSPQFPNTDLLEWPSLVASTSGDQAPNPPAALRFEDDLEQWELKSVKSTGSPSMVCDSEGPSGLPVKPEPFDSISSSLSTSASPPLPPADLHPDPYSSLDLLYSEKKDYSLAPREETPATSVHESLPSPPKQSATLTRSPMSVPPSLSESGATQKTALVPPSNPPISNNRFQPLIATLKSLRAGGNVRPLRSVVYAHLLRNYPKAFQSVGATQWKSYAAHALADGLVTMGGVQGRDWIALPIEPAFLPMVRFLEQKRKQGIPNLVRSAVRDGLYQLDPTFMTRYNFSSWKTYASKAQDDGYVQLLDQNKREARIALHPRWHGRVE